MNVLGDYLQDVFPEISPIGFYRNIFPAGELDENMAFTKGKYTGIALEIFDEPENGRNTRRYTVTDDLDVIRQLQKSDHFCIISPISYAGKTRESCNARYMYALVVELDDLIVNKDEQYGVERLMTQWTERVHLIPQPTYLIASGTGLHLYYQFDEPLPMYQNVVKSLVKYKKRITELIWNRHVTESNTKDKIQYESIFQGFRMVGTKTKLGDKVRAFVTGEKVDISYMNRFVAAEYQIKLDDFPKSKISLEEAKEQFPEWYDRRIIQGEERRGWVCKEDLYNWWLRKIGEDEEAVVGHRYYCMMCLCIYAIKCNIPYERLEKDCFDLMVVFEARTDDERNHFTKRDVMDALQVYEDRGLIRYPIDIISQRSGIQIEKNKRNGRKRAEHVKYMRGMKVLRMTLGEDVKGGRPTKRDEVLSYLAQYPNARKCDVVRGTGLSRMTVDKYYEECGGGQCKQSKS